MRERARLAELWRASEKGRAQLVLISGEPGAGKTRLVEELRAWCVHRGAVTAEARSFRAEGALAYGPVVAWLRSQAIITRLARLDRARLTELARLLPDLLTEVPGLPFPEPLPESDHRQRMFDAIARALLATGAPLLLVADDLHWCDLESLQFLHYLLRVEPRARLLVAATARREEVDDRHPLHDLLTALQAMGRCEEIALERLSPEETAALAERITGRRFETAEANLLYSETEGNPLFIVEALRAGWSGEDAGRVWLSPRVQAVIESRLARLSDPARHLIGIAATIGREFTTDILSRASEGGGDVLVRGLDELWRRRIIREHGADAYDFSHDKIREVAYLNLSPIRRRYLHLRVAQALEQSHAGDQDPVSGQLAAHYENAGAFDRAVVWYERAAGVARRMYADAEAIRLLDRALDLLRELSATPERQARELAILTALAGPLPMTEGAASDRLAAVHQRALEVAEALGVEPAPPLLRSLAIASLGRRDFAAAKVLGEQLRMRGAREADEMLVVESHYVLGIASFWQGEFVDARMHFEAAVARYRPAQCREHLLRFGLDPKVICQSRLGNTLWFLGYAEAAVRAHQTALALAEEIGHPFSLGTALAFAMVLALDMRDADGVRTYAALLATEQAKHGMRPNDVATEHFGGYIDVLDGRMDAGIARIRRALDESRQGDHAPGMRAFSVRVLLEACAVAGDARTGLATAEWALALPDAHRIWEAETRRLRAEFLAALDAPPSEVEAEFERALAVAHRQGAKMLALRTARSLLRFQLAASDVAGQSKHASSWPRSSRSFPNEPILQICSTP